MCDKKMIAYFFVAHLFVDATDLFVIHRPLRLAQRAVFRRVKKRTRAPMEIPAVRVFVAKAV